MVPERLFTVRRQAL